MNRQRRSFMGAGLAAAAVAPAMACRREPPCGDRSGPGAASAPAASDEEYVWVSAAASLPLFVGHDHPALFAAAKELGVKASIAGPGTTDIPGLVAAVEQVAARRPAGMMVVGWDPSALVPAIDNAI